MAKRKNKTGKTYSFVHIDSLLSTVQSLSFFFARSTDFFPFFFFVFQPFFFVFRYIIVCTQCTRFVKMKSLMKTTYECCWLMIIIALRIIMIITVIIFMRTYTAHTFTIYTEKKNVKRYTIKWYFHCAIEHRVKLNRTELESCTPRPCINKLKCIF